MRDRVILAVRWVAAISCPIWLGLVLIIASYQLYGVVCLAVCPPNDMPTPFSKDLYRNWMMAEPFFIGLPVAFCVGVLAPRWKFYAALIIVFAPLFLVLSYELLQDVLRESAYEDLFPTAVKSAGVILGAALGCGLVLKVFGNGKETV